MKAEAQTYYGSYQTAKDTAKARYLAIGIKNNNFIKNNEYFGPYTEGITYIGSVLQPELQWHVAQDVDLTTGWYFRQFYGKQGFEKSLPVIKLTWKVNKDFHLVIGQLNERFEHPFLEPLYSADRYFTVNPEYGVQAIFNSKHLYAETFLDWEKFLLPGEAHQEFINGGLLASYYFKDKIEGLSIDVQSIIHHEGGQVDATDKPLKTRANIAGDINYNWKWDSRWANRLKISASLMQALELSQTRQIPIEQGFALYPNFLLGNEWLKLQGGWFHGEDFFAPLGDYLFQSVSQFNNEQYISKKRDIITAKLLIDHKIANGVNFAFKVETYYDTQREAMDYSYGLNISLNAGLFTKVLSK